MESLSSHSSSGRVAQYDENARTSSNEEEKENQEPVLKKRRGIAKNYTFVKKFTGLKSAKDRVKLLYDLFEFAWSYQRQNNLIGGQKLWYKCNRCCLSSYILSSIWTRDKYE